MALLRPDSGSLPLELVAWGFSELRLRDGLAIDRDPWTVALPFIGHDLKFQCDGLQLGLRCVANFYCEFFHRIVFQLVL